MPTQMYGNEWQTRSEHRRKVMKTPNPFAAAVSVLRTKCASSVQGLTRLEGRQISLRRIQRVSLRGETICNWVATSVVSSSAPLYSTFVVLELFYAQCD